MKCKIALLMAFAVALVICFGSFVSVYAALMPGRVGGGAVIIWNDNSDEAGKRPSTIVITSSDGNSYSVSTAGSNRQSQPLMGDSSAIFPDIENYTKEETAVNASDYDENVYTYYCTYTYQPNTEVSIPIQLTMPATAEEATDIDVTVPEKISFVADDNGDFSSDFTVENKSSSMAVDTILSATPYGEWKIVPGTTNFDTMGANQKKFSLLAEESTASNIDLSDSTYTFNIVKSGTQKITLKGKTGPVTDNVVKERCVTVSLYITQAS